MAGEHRGRARLKALKAAAVPRGPMLTIPVGMPMRAVLRPVSTRQDVLDPDDVARLTAWRNRFVRAFLTEFEASIPQTERWLVTTVGPADTRIIFMVDDAAGRTLATMGVAAIDWTAGTFEVDGVVRGEAGQPGLMGDALRTLIGWAQSQLGLPEAHVRVLSDNSAQDFYRRVGFREVRRVPLRKVVESDMTRWVETDGPPDQGRSLIFMLWDE